MNKTNEEVKTECIVTLNWVNPVKTGWLLKCQNKIVSEKFNYRQG